MTFQESAKSIEAHLVLLDIIFHRIPKGDALDERTTLVLAHIRKAQHIARVCLSLASDGHVEEVFGLTRTLSEVVVNATYLQIADEIEITRYIMFEASHLLRKTRKMMSHNPEPPDHSPELVKQVEAVAAAAKAATGRGDKDRVWSKYSGLEDRAGYADQSLSTPILKLLVTSAAVRGDASIHATIHSMSSFIRALNRGEDVLDEAQLNDVALAMHCCAFGIGVLSQTMNDVFALGMEDLVRSADRPNA